MNRGAVPWSALITFLASACCLCDQHCSTAQHLSSGWCPSRGQRCSPIQHLLSVRLVGQRSVDCLPGEDCRAASLLSARPGLHREAGHSSDTPEKRQRSVSLSCTVFLFQRISGSVYDTHAHVSFQKRVRGVRFFLKRDRGVKGAPYTLSMKCWRSVKGASKERKEKNRTLPDSCLLLTVWRIHCFLF